MNKQQREDIDEANAMLDFRQKEMTWKAWAIIAAVGFVTYVFITGLQTIFE